MSEERGSLGTTLVVFLAGAAVGAAVVALLTPKSGPDLRADLLDLGGKLKQRVDRLRGECCKGAGQGDPAPRPFAGG